ncbi:unnamed protein product [Linum tenue]|uniref:S-adenosylmethionine-dependent methyltransferase n=1 Tax=Linum tenue TaxID=586396 RepID=A0AAV0H6F3_9ROSI|nr:unnamed protein product [Linum tenue]
MAATGTSYPMNGGNGLHSYTNNSKFQRGPADAIKQMTNTAIVDNNVSFASNNTTTIRVGDMGCSVGPNTFLSLQNILQSLRCKMANDSIEYQVFLNDHTSNDFNTLFAQSVPHQDSYYVAGVPGSFHGRLFPAASLHVVHSSYALQWLSRVPNSVLDCNSPAWNKGEICYCSGATGGGKEESIVGAYKEQFGMDLGCFLNARASEVVGGGLMLVVIPGRSNETSHSKVTSNVTYSLLGSCLMDMAHKGLISEGKVDSLNIPIYFASPEEVEAAVEANGSFGIVTMECIKQGRGPGTAESKARAISAHIRAGMEELLKLHFGDDGDGDRQTVFPMDELFRSYEHKLLTCGFFQGDNSGEAFTLFAALKRKHQ